MISAVVDTNVFVSALLTQNQLSPTVTILNQLLNGKFKIVYSVDILKEYVEVLHRVQFNIESESIIKLIKCVLQNGELANGAAYYNKLVDENDRAFLEAFLSKEDCYLVTGNMKHFPKHKNIITPSEFVKFLEE
ncbi:MAG: putative toxin-antitoxin system toxin component, PIN family [Paludibacteraceae bacterium]|nr:putative toxin-antitoxin system toxin component, PIN family [Paludibacteraceae bacterium]